MSIISVSIWNNCEIVEVEKKVEWKILMAEVGENINAVPCTI